ncbi:MAG: preprotein translocase subunit SecY [Candidatus Altiarchaeota archaeon]
MDLEFIRPTLKYIPEVSHPRRHVSFNEKVSWTGAILILFFIMGVIYPYGVSPEKLEERIRGFAQLQIIFASSMGSIISTGIGPIVTASIILQLLIGSKMLDVDLKKMENRALFQGTQKILTVIIAFFEATALVVVTHMVDVPVVSGEIVTFQVIQWLRAFTILQLALGSIILMYLDEVVSKWGIGSGISLFIAGGVSQVIITRSFNILPNPGGGYAGIIPNFIYWMTNGDLQWFMLWPLIGTIIVFLVVVFGESMRLEIPLSYGGIRGVGGRYPLRFFYVSNIPVILAAALLMNVSMWAGFAGVDVNDPALRVSELSGLQRAVYFITTNITLGRLNGILSPDRISEIWDPSIVVHFIIYAIAFTGLCVLFGQFWVQTTGLGPEEVADQIHQGGMQIPGFRRDKRVIQRMLGKYIPQITIISSVAVGLLAAGADLLGAVGSGTGILLTVGIIYRLYEEVQKEQMSEMHPMFRRILGKE